MKREEAIEILGCIYMEVSTDDDKEAVDMAITALKEETICPILSDDEVKQPCIKSPCGIERLHGEWIYHKEWEIDGECAFECSKCGMGVDVDYNFCPNCGLPMNEKALEILRKREGDQE